MTQSDTISVVRSRLRKLRDRNDSLQTIIEIATGQLARQRAEIRACLQILESAERPVTTANARIPQAA